MPRSPEQDAIWQTLETLPNWGFSDHGNYHIYWVEWHYPPFYEKHADKTAASPRLQQIIVERCQFILDSGQFDIDWVELKFYKHGLIIDVPGNACGIYPDTSDHGQYGSHNVDSAAQCFSLLFFFLTALHEIYSFMISWDENPTAGIDGEPTDRTYRLERSNNSRRYELWRLEEEFRLKTLIYARTRREAEEIVQEANLDGDVRPAVMSDFPFVSALRLWKVQVNLGEAGVKYYQVLAYDNEDAEELVRQKLEEEPLLFPTQSIIAEKYQILQPMVVK